MVTSPGVFDATAQAPAGTPAAAAGQTLHGDHAYVFYQVPANARRLPLVMWHGIGQFSKTWETTPDGREGYQTIFLRRGFGGLSSSTSRAAAGRDGARSTARSAATPDEQNWFGTFSLGIWPDFFPGVQFSRDPEALNQYFRQMAPNVGPIDVQVNAAAVAALFTKIGPGILVTHSHSGGMGWRTAISSQNVRAIVSYEPGQRLRVPGRRGSAASSELGSARSRRRHPAGGLHAAHRRSRSSSTTVTTSRRQQIANAGQEDGVRDWRWHGCGATPSTSGAAT